MCDTLHHLYFVGQDLTSFKPIFIAADKRSLQYSTTKVFGLEILGADDDMLVKLIIDDLISSSKSGRSTTSVSYVVHKNKT